MSALNRQRDPALRVVSLLLLLSALGSLVLSMVRISFSPVFIAELQRFPGLGTLPAACVNGGIASYSGLSLATGGAHSEVVCNTLPQFPTRVPTRPCYAWWGKSSWARTSLLSTFASTNSAPEAEIV